MEIRRAGSADVGAVLEVWRAADAVPSISDDAESIQRLIDRDAEALLVAVEGDRIVGTLISGWDGWRALFYRLAVVPDVRRSGIATALVRAGEERLRSLGAKRVIAMVVVEHDDAVRFWRALGYIHEARMGRYISDL